VRATTRTEIAVRRYLTPGCLMLLAAPVAVLAILAGDLSVVIGRVGLTAAGLIYLTGSLLWFLRTARPEGPAWLDALLAWAPGAPVYIALAALLAPPGGPDAAAMIAIPLLYVAGAFVIGSSITTIAVFSRANHAARGTAPALSAVGSTPIHWRPLLLTAAVVGFVVLLALLFHSGDASMAGLVTAMIGYVVTTDALLIALTKLPAPQTARGRGLMLAAKLAAAAPVTGLFIFGLVYALVEGDVGWNLPGIAFGLGVAIWPFLVAAVTAHNVSETAV
jgi:hypothetical protein